MVRQALVLETARTKHYMADEKYLYSALYYPRAVAKVRMPLGIPSGPDLQINMDTGSNSSAHDHPFLFFVTYHLAISASYFMVLLGGIADRNPISEEFKQQVLKHVPTMRSYGLSDAAEYLEKWVCGRMELEPLLDVTAFLWQT